MSPMRVRDLSSDFPYCSCIIDKTGLVSTHNFEEKGYFKYCRKNKNDVKSFHLDRENLKFFEYFE